MSDNEQIDVTPDGTPEAPSDLRAQLESAMAETVDQLPLVEGESQTSDPDEDILAPETASEDSEGEALAPPVSWTKEAQADWTKLPEHIMREVLRREGEIQSKLSDDGPIRALEKRIEPYKQIIEQSGVTIDQYVGNLMGWNYALRQDPRQAIAALTQQFISDQSLQKAVINALQGQRPSDDYDMPDPVEQTYDPRVDQLQQQIRQMDYQNAMREFQAFCDAKDGDGNLIHPYANDVKSEMAVEVQANPAISYDQAYEIAVWKNPETREKMIAEHQGSQARTRASVARKAKSMDLPSGRSDVQAPNGSTGDLRKDLINTYRALS